MRYLWEKTDHWQQCQPRHEQNPPPLAAQSAKRQDGNH
jgi:hypothetical protein